MGSEMCIRDSTTAVEAPVPALRTNDLPPPYTPVDDESIQMSRIKPEQSPRGGTDSTKVEPLEPLPIAFSILLHSLRLFAAVPGAVGTIFLASNARSAILEGNYFRHALSSTPGAAEYLVCCLWSMCTTYHAISLMTLLLRRWLIYYALLPAVIRLIAFQSICWSLVRICLYVFGPALPIGAWVSISTFTAANDCIARWVTSNITDVQYDERMSETEASASEAESSDPRMRRRRQCREGGIWLIRVLVGGPLDMDELERSVGDSDDEHIKRPIGRLRSNSIGLNSDHEADNEASSRTLRVPMATRQRNRRPRRPRRQRRRQSRASEALFFQNNRAARIHSRRVFHWDVAMWRNVVPIAVLGYITLWVLILGWCMPRLVS